MIYDVETLCWWRFVLPLTDGQPTIRRYQHRVRDWWVVWDPSCTPHVYWVERERQEYSNTPPLVDKEVGVQTDDNASGDMCVQTDGNASGDIWDILRQSVSDLPVDKQYTIFHRLERFLDMGLLYP